MNSYDLDISVMDYARRELHTTRQIVTGDKLSENGSYFVADLSRSDNDHQWDESMFCRLGGLGIGTGCGEDCRVAIDRARHLITILDSETSAQDVRCDFRRLTVAAVILATHQACEIYYFG